MEASPSRLHPNIKHSKCRGEVTYSIFAQKEGIFKTQFPNREKKTLLDWYLSIRERTIFICKPLYIEDFVSKYSAFSSIKWHLGHTTWLFERYVLRVFLKKYTPFQETFDQIFHSSENANQDKAFSRPSLDTVMAYRKQIDEKMEVFIKEEFSFLSEVQKEEIESIFSFILDLEKESQEEILTQIKAGFFENDFYGQYWSCTGEAFSKSRQILSSPQWIFIKGGLVNIGSDGKEFAFDMEMPRHTRYIESFEITQRPVTNGEFLQFVEKGGYERGGLWLEEGFEQIKRLKRVLPRYWKRSGSAIKQFTLSGIQPLNLNEPVSHLNYFEADAYARYARARLPSEIEWELASQSLKSLNGNFLNQGHLHPQPLKEDDLRIAPRLHAMFGDVWEWTSSLYSPYPRFEPADICLWKYTGRLEGSKRVVRGGSCLFDGEGFRRTCRKPISLFCNEYCTGLRLVRSV